MKGEPYPLVKAWNPRLKRNEWVETEPDACPTCGASWGKPGSMQRGYRTCGKHRGHRKWTCSTCRAEVVNRAADAPCF